MKMSCKLKDIDVDAISPLGTGRTDFLREGPCLIEKNVSLDVSVYSMKGVKFKRCLFYIRANQLKLIRRLVKI